MWTSESHDDESSSSTSEIEEILDYELEIEKFESLSDGAFHSDVPNASKKNVASLSALHRTMMNLLQMRNGYKTI